MTVRTIIRACRKHPNPRVRHYAGLIANDTRKIERHPELPVLREVRAISLRGLERAMIEGSSRAG